MTDAYQLAQAAGFPTTAAYIRHLATRAHVAELDAKDARREIARLNTLIDAHTCPKETQP